LLPGRTDTVSESPSERECLSLIVPVPSVDLWYGSANATCTTSLLIRDQGDGIV